MENKTNKSQNPYELLCCHNDSKTWQPACENCLRDAEAYKRFINSLKGKQCYLISFCDLAWTSKQSKTILPLLKKIPKVIHRKLMRRVEYEKFFVLPFSPELKINERGEKAVAVEIKGDKFKLNFVNQFMKVPITWRREEMMLMAKKPYIGLVCRIQKKVHP